MGPLGIDKMNFKSHYRKYCAYICFQPFKMPNKSFFFLVCLLLSSFLAKAQNSRYTDSLAQVLKTAKADTSRAKLLNDLGWEFVYSTPGKALDYGKEELALSEKLNYQKGVFDSYTLLGSIRYIQSDLAHALQYHKSALAVSEAMKYPKGILISNSNIGVVYKDLGNHVLELKSCLAALKIAESTADTSRMAAIYLNLGLASQAQKDYAAALEYNNRALKIREQRHDQRGIAACYINSASVLTDQTNYRAALDLQRKALEICIDLKDNYQLAKCYSNMGLNYKNLGEYTAALDCLNKGLLINEQLKSKSSQAALLINMGEVYSRQHNPLALPIYEKALALAKEIGHRKWQMETWLGLSNLYAANKNADKALACFKNYSALKDSLLNEDYNKQMANMQVVYDTEKKEIDIRVLKQQEKLNSFQITEQQALLQKRKYQALAGGLLMVALLLASYLYIYRQRILSTRRQEQAVRDTEENERLRIAKDIHDDLGSGLSKIKFLTELVSAKAGANPELKSSITSISETAGFLVGNMRDLIWALNPENTTLDSLVARIREYSSDYLNDFPIELKISSPDNIPAREIAKEAHRNIFFIVKECLNNIVKHANANLVTLNLEISSTELSVCICDNGQGLPDHVSEKGRGLKNIRQRAAFIHSTADISRLATGGTKVCLVSPLARIQKA
jgi:two-component system NarL family sensor kinase